MLRASYNHEYYAVGSLQQKKKRKISFSRQSEEFLKSWKELSCSHLKKKKECWMLPY